MGLVSQLEWTPLTLSNGSLSPSPSYDPLPPLFIRRVRKNAKKRLFGSACPSAWNNSASTGQIFVKFDI